MNALKNFPNSGLMSLIFPIRKALGPLPNVAEKNPWITHMQAVHVFKFNPPGFKNKKKNKKKKKTHFILKFCIIYDQSHDIVKSEKVQPYSKG